MSEELTCDFCVIGAGAGGLAVVTEAAQMGLRVVLVEKGEVGGVESRLAAQAFIAAARAAHQTRQARRFGVGDGAPAVRVPAVMAHVRSAQRAGRPDVSEARLRALGVTLVRGAGRFIGRERLEAGGRVIRARRFVIATGSTPVIPPLPGLEQIRLFTPETIFDIGALPERMVVLGAGPAGLELGLAFKRLGAGVVILDGARALPQEDEEFAELAVAALLREGLDLREGVRIARAEALPGAAFRLHLESGETIEGSHLLVASSRRPAIDGLGLEAAGVLHASEGLRLDANLRASNRRIACIGAVAGAMSAEAAQAQAARVVSPSLFGWRAQLRDRLRIIRIDPEIAACGLSEAEARKRRRGLQVLRWPLAETGQARAEGLKQGHVKIVAARNGRVLGATIAGPGAGDMIGAFQIAVSRRLKLDDIAALAAAGGFGEACGRAARGVLTPGSGRSWARRLLGALRKIG